MGGSYGDPSEKNLTILLKWKENQEETLHLTLFQLVGTLQ